MVAFALLPPVLAQMGIAPTLTWRSSAGTFFVVAVSYLAWSIPRFPHKTQNSTTGRRTRAEERGSGAACWSLVPFAGCRGRDSRSSAVRSLRARIPVPVLFGSACSAMFSGSACTSVVGVCARGARRLPCIGFGGGAWGGSLGGSHRWWRF